MMKATDTVMSELELKIYRWLKKEYGYTDSKLVARMIGECQLAEISFKAGKEEVVEFVRSFEQTKEGLTWVTIPHYDWQAKLKEWEIE